MSCYQSSPAAQQDDAYVRARSGDAYADWVKRTVEGFPPMTAEQRARAVVLLNPPGVL